MGYSGAGLIESYKNNPQDEIILLDKRFVPHLLVNLPPHFRFIEGDILDKDLMKVLLKDVDIIYHLAGEVEAENSTHKEKAIWENNYDGSVTA